MPASTESFTRPNVDVVADQTGGADTASSSGEQLGYDLGDYATNPTYVQLGAAPASKSTLDEVRARAAAFRAQGKELLAMNVRAVKAKSVALAQGKTDIANDLQAMIERIQDKRRLHALGVQSLNKLNAMLAAVKLPTLGALGALPIAVPIAAIVLGAALLATMVAVNSYIGKEKQALEVREKTLGLVASGQLPATALETDPAGRAGDMLSGAAKLIAGGIVVALVVPRILEHVGGRRG